MIEKVLVILYRMKGGQPQFFIGCRPDSKLYQPITGHKETKDRSIVDTVKRELEEETGLKSFRNFINIGDFFTWKRGDETVREYVFGIEVGRDKINLEKKEFSSYEFVALREALKLVKFDSHKKYLKLINKRVLKQDYPKIFVLCGPSGSGKETIMQEVAKKIGIKRANTVTTRQKRSGEVSARLFVSPQEFKQLETSGEIIEKNDYHGHWYGSIHRETNAPQENGRDVLIELDINGVKAYQKLFSNLVTIFIKVKIGELRERLKIRATEPDDVIEKRLRTAKIEMENQKLCDYTIENKKRKVNIAINEVIRIIKKKGSS